nr:MAG TPA: deoxyuridine 5'-triphosphate nucleotidohydrolase [Caudoviricetes sp.]
MADIVEFVDNKETNSFDELANSIPGLEGIQALAGVLDLSDADFEALRPILLEELEKGFNNSNDKYNLALAFNMSGLSTAELRATFEGVLNKIDEDFSQYDEQRRSFLKQILAMMINSIETGKATHNRIIRIPIELCKEGAKVPTYAHDGDAGCDVYALDDYTVEPNQTMIIPLGFKVAVPFGYEL